MSCFGWCTEEPQAVEKGIAHGEEKLKKEPVKIGLMAAPDLQKVEDLKKRSRVSPKKLAPIPAPPLSRSTQPPPPKPSEDPAVLALALTLEEVKEATGGFDQEMYLGEGSSGRVFHGRLTNGADVAVKVLKGPMQSEEDFLSQVAALSKLNHENVVALKGFCMEDDTRMLVYELAPYGSLHDVLHGWKEVKEAKPGPMLHWQQRIRVAMGAAKGLRYLHEQAITSFPHKGVKSSNIMLFDDYVAKLGDFNLSGQTADAAAPFDPEHEFSKQLISEKVQAQKADIYGLGVVLLELLTGRRPVDPSAPHNQQSLVTWAMPRLSGDKVKKIVDPRLKGRFPAEGPSKLGLAAALCMDDVDYRPPASTVIDALQPLMTMPMPTRQASGSNKSGPL